MVSLEEHGGFPWPRMWTPVLATENPPLIYEVPVRDERPDAADGEAGGLWGNFCLERDCIRKGREAGHWSSHGA